MRALTLINPGKEHTNGTCTDDLRGYDFLIGRKAYYRLRPKDKVKNLPEDARVAFEKIPGGQPSVDFMGGTFFSITWAYPVRADTPCDQPISAAAWTTCDPAGFPEATRIPRQPGDYLVEEPDGGVSIVAAADVAVPDDRDDSAVRRLPEPQRQLPPPGERNTSAEGTRLQRDQKP